MADYLLKTPRVLFPVEAVSCSTSVLFLTRCRLTVVRGWLLRNQSWYLFPSVTSSTRRSADPSICGSVDLWVRRSVNPSICRPVDPSVGFRTHASARSLNHHSGTLRTPRVLPVERRRSERPKEPQYIPPSVSQLSSFASTTNALQR